MIETLTAMLASPLMQRGLLIAALVGISAPVIGLGLIGQLVVQLLVASGVRVVAIGLTVVLLLPVAAVFVSNAGAKAFGNASAPSSMYERLPKTSSW